MAEIQNNYLDGVSQVALTDSGTAVIEPHSFPEGTTVVALLDGKSVPGSMESSSVDIYVSEKPITDKDGDGIPDDSDKYAGRSTADVAAEKHGIGKYSKSNKTKDALISSKKTMKAVSNLLDSISAQSAASLNKTKGAKKESSFGGDSEDGGDSFGLKSDKTDDEKK